VYRRLFAHKVFDSLNGKPVLGLLLRGMELPLITLASGRGLSTKYFDAVHEVDAFSPDSFQSLMYFSGMFPVTS
jgi:hypothetical protein